MKKIFTILKTIKIRKNITKVAFSTIMLLIINSANAQFSFTFSAVGGAFTANAAPTIIHAAGVDDALSAAINIGFTFNYNCTNYTQVRVSSNGWFTFNTAVTASNAYNDLDLSTDRPIIAPLWDDIAVGAGSTVNYKLTGSSPNRVFTIEWSQMEWTYSGTAWAVGFQAKIYETTNVIEFIYNRNGNATFNTVSPSASIGLSGGAGQFYSLTDVTGAPTASTVVETDVLASKPATGQIYRWTPAPVCSGTPTAGTITAPASVCSSVPTNITLTGATSGCGISYQWQSSPTGGAPWTNVGTSSTTYVVSQTSATYYHCVVTCSNGGGNATTPNVLINMSAPTSCYCASSATSTADLDIFNITFGTINNTTADINLTGTQGVATGTAGMYSNWRSSAVPVPSFEQGTANAFAVTIGGTQWSHRVDVYIDFNQDGDFIDAGESLPIFAYASPTVPNTTNSSITIPGTATLGNTVMRVVCVESSITSACGTYTWGETEDYNINITAATPMAYASCTTTQANVTAVTTGSTAQEIIGIRIVTTGSTSPISVTQFTVNANGSTAIVDINTANSAKIYYTGNSSTFATTTYFGQNTPTIVNFNINGSQTLLGGTNYFWLVYDIKPTATAGNVVDAQCTSLTVGIARTPTVTAPAGSRPIVNQVTIGTGTSTGTYPFYINYDYARSASLFTAAEVGSPTIITQLAWNVSTPQTTNVPIKIYLKTITASTLTSDTWANMIAGATLVYNATTSFTPAGWKTINITDFSYCADNLLVLCEQNIGTYTTPISFYYTAATDMHQTWNQDVTPPVGTGTVGSSRPNIRIDRLPAVVTIPNCATYLTPANGASGIICGANAILTWAPNITGCNPPTDYEVFFGTSSTPPSISDQPGTSYNPGTLLPSTTYYWRIVPSNSAGAAVCPTVWSFTTGATFNPSQTVPPLTDGFENCTDWTIVNGAQPNVWINGNATAYTGTKSMYIHNGGGTDNDYDIAASSVVHFYKDISFPPGNNDYTLKFYWKGMGESSLDYLQVFLAPTSITPVAGSQVSTTYQLTPYIYNQSAIWQYFSNSLQVACAGNETWRLIFSWKNDASVGTQPPIAIDDIMITMTARTGSTCANPINATLPFTRTGETTSCMNDDYTNASSSSCGSSYESGNDKVYRVLVGAAGCVNVTLSGCSSNSIGFQVYNGCPDVGGSTCIYNSTTGATAGTLSNDINIPSAGFYYFIVDNWAAPSTVNYNIAISTPGGNTVNDPCTGAIDLTLGISTAGDNTCTNAAGEPAVPACWTTGAMNTVWYRVVIPASRDLAIRTTSGSLLSTQIDVYRGNACGTLTYVDCNQDASSCGTLYNNSYLLLNNIGAGTYAYIRVDGENDLVGTFSIMVVDGNNGSPVWQPIVGQDCGPVTTYTNPVCGQTTNINNPGYYAYGNFCDFTGAGICLASGERSSVWYTININAAGNLNFDIIPNDYGNPNPLTGQVNPGYFSQGDETDYDWAIWKWEAACDGTGDGAFCCTEIAAGSTAATRCNYNSLGVTGLSATGNSPAAYPGFDAAYEAQIAVANGEMYVLAISNFADDYVSGYTIQFSGTSPVAFAVPGATLTWSSMTSNAWSQPGNWGGCSAPNCSLNATVASGGAQPVITANATVKDLTINAGATLTINAGVTLTLCGNFINNGNLVMSPTATLLFNNASVAQTISGSLTGANKIGGLTITKTGSTVTLGNPIDIGGNFTTSNTTSIFNANNQVVKLAGNFSTAANTTLTNCPNIEFNGFIPQTYTNSSGTITWTNVIMNNTGGGITLSGTATSNLVIAGALTLTNGLIYTANPPLLIMNAGSTSTAGSALSFVDGPMQKIGNTAFVFPVGDAFNRWRRVGMSAPTASTTFQAQYFYTPYSNTSSLAVTPTPILTNVSLLEYWQFDRVGVAANASLTLYWENAASSGITSCAALQGGDLVVARWNGSAWENRSNVVVGGITGSCVGSAAGTVTSDVLSVFSPFTFASKAVIVNPLPIELVSFTGKNNITENILEWETAIEINNDYFTLERAKDGFTFEELAKIKGAGNSNSTLKYQFIDKAPFDGTTFYRLKQTNLDGTESYAHNIVSLRIKLSVDYVIYPNPANENILIYNTASTEENVTIEINDISGRVVMKENSFNVKGVNEALSLDIQDFNEGIYFITIKDINNNKVIQKKFVKAK